MHKVFTNLTHLIGLLAFVNCKDVDKLRICHQIAMKNPEIIVGRQNIDTRGFEVMMEGVSKQKESLDTFLLLPPKLVKCAQESKGKEQKDSREKLFSHIVSFRNRNFSPDGEQRNQTVAPYLDAKVTKDQQRLLNPSVLETITGFIIKDSIGDGAKKRIQNRLNFIDATVALHCTVFNSEEQMQLIKEANAVAAVMANIETNQLKTRRRQSASGNSKKPKRRKRKRRNWNKRKKKKIRRVSTTKTS